jgi:hypothetical protein
MTMTDQNDSFDEVLATGALVLMMGAFVAGVFSFVEWGHGNTATALIIGLAAAIGFAASLAYFVVESRAEPAAAELPFPSWLRAEVDA